MSDLSSEEREQIDVAALAWADRMADLGDLHAAVERILAARGVRAPSDTTADRDALGMAWDDGNATGLDGYVGPGRGTEPDPEGIDARERYLDRALAARPAPDTLAAHVPVADLVAAVADKVSIAGTAGRLRVELDDLRNRLRAVLDEHHHADTCDSALVPGDSCSCWQSDLRALLAGRPDASPEGGGE